MLRKILLIAIAIAAFASCSEMQDATDADSPDHIVREFQSDDFDNEFKSSTDVQLIDLGNGSGAEPTNFPECSLSSLKGDSFYAHEVSTLHPTSAGVAVDYCYHIVVGEGGYIHQNTASSMTKALCTKEHFSQTDVVGTYSRIIYGTYASAPSDTTQSYKDGSPLWCPNDNKRSGSLHIVQDQSLANGKSPFAVVNEKPECTYNVTIHVPKCVLATDSPTLAPTHIPTLAPTHSPTLAPTHSPTEAPTHIPTEAPTHIPTEAPTHIPTEAPTQSPTEAPTHTPTEAPTHTPTEAPTHSPTVEPTNAPTLPPTLPFCLKHIAGSTCGKWYAPSTCDDWRGSGCTQCQSSGCEGNGNSNSCGCGADTCACLGACLTYDQMAHVVEVYKATPGTAEQICQSNEVSDKSDYRDIFGEQGTYPGGEQYDD